MLLRTTISSFDKIANCTIKVIQRMASTTSMAVSPPIHRLKPGESLDRDAFHKTISVAGLKIPASRTTELMKSLGSIGFANYRV